MCRVCSRPQVNLVVVQNLLLWPERTVCVKREARYRTNLFVVFRAINSHFKTFFQVIFDRFSKFFVCGFLWLFLNQRFPKQSLISPNNKHENQNNCKFHRCCCDSVSGP